MLAMARGAALRSAARHLRLALIVTTHLGGTVAYRSMGTGSVGTLDADEGRGHKDAGALPLELMAEVTYLPDSAKVARGSQGEDAYMISKYGVAVADGVGGWIEAGVDAGKYSRALMAGTQRSIEARVAATDGGAVAVDPLDALEDGYRETTEQGSSTACVATVSSSGLLRVRNLGDSGLLAYRREKSLSLIPGRALRLEEAEKLWTPLFKTTEQVHDFNFPYQLEAAERSDKPASAQALQYWVLPGDLLLLATDGFLDNMWPHDTLRALAKVDWEPCAALVRLKRARVAEARAAEGGGADAVRWSPYRTAGHSAPVSPAEMATAERACRATLLSISAALAVGAQRVGMDRGAKSPFADGAKRAGLRYTGGKPDDVAVVAAVVLPDESRALLARGGEEEATGEAAVAAAPAGG